jgi:microsomal dipeptidase-like Zn-dependent dipeptidase
MALTSSSAVRIRCRSLCLLALASVGCHELLVPGLLPPQTEPRPIVPEPMLCGPGVYPPPVAVPAKPIVGAADFHNHQFANLGFGGRVLWGKSFDPAGIDQALSSCGAEDLCVDEREATMCRLACSLAPSPESCRDACDQAKCESSTPHGHLGITDPIGLALGQGYGHSVRGYPEFQGWPNYNTYTHQQEYYTWVKRAFDGGMKLMVMLALSNETLCQVLGHDHPCDDMTNVDLQLEEANKLERFVDWQVDCIPDNNNGWYRIARTPQQARDIIASGAMAVVLGIEVDQLFNCRQHGCTTATFAQQIEKYQRAGVRHVFPVHLMNNGIGGTAASNDLFNFGNVAINKRLLDVRDCASDGYSFKFGKLSTVPNDFLHFMAEKVGADYPKYPESGAHCNQLGLEPVGGEALKLLMKAKMLIDVDHMSAKARQAALGLMSSCGYPGVISGHSGFVSLNRGQKLHEGQLTDADVKGILGQGGLLSPILHQGARDEIKAYGTKVPNDCGASAKSFAQAYLYAVDAMKANQRTPLAVGFGSDLNGFAGMPTPRFGRYACGNDGEPQSNKVQYPFTPLHGSVASMEQMQAGYRVFDINLDGFANIGMFPDFVQELRAIGLTEAELDPLFGAAEAYITLWESVDKLEQVTCN